VDIEHGLRGPADRHRPLLPADHEEHGQTPDRVEIIAKGITLALIASGYARENILVAQSLAITVIVVDVAVIATALAIIISINRHTKSLDVRKLTKLKG